MQTTSRQKKNIYDLECFFSGFTHPESNRGKQTGTHDSTPLNASELLTRFISK